jgi:hypothetical protein
MEGRRKNGMLCTSSSSSYWYLMERANWSSLIITCSYIHNQLAEMNCASAESTDLPHHSKKLTVASHWRVPTQCWGHQLPCSSCRYQNFTNCIIITLDFRARNRGHNS